MEQVRPENLFSEADVMKAFGLTNCQTLFQMQGLFLVRYHELGKVEPNRDYTFKNFYKRGNFRQAGVELIFLWSIPSPHGGRGWIK